MNTLRINNFRVIRQERQENIEIRRFEEEEMARNFAIQQSAGNFDFYWLERNTFFDQHEPENDDFILMEIYQNGRIIGDLE